MKKCLLDTDILSFYFKGFPKVVERAEAYLLEHQKFTLSAITYYEILRGLEHRDAFRQIERFKLWIGKHELLDADAQVMERGATLHAFLKKQGITIGDPDVLNAATALVHSVPLNTNNTKHYKDIPDLELLNWKQES